METNGDGSKLLVRTLTDISQLLESADKADERVKRVLELLRDLVPYEQCALLEARLGLEPNVVVMPETSPEERVLLTATMLDIFGQLVEANTRQWSPATRPKGAHLAVPLVGLDEVIGLIFVRLSVGEYTEEQLRALSVIAAKLSAYFPMLRARAELAELARERDEARLSAEAANRAKDEFLALVSHELKTPLSSILGWAEILRSTTDDTALRAHAIDELEGNVRAQSKLIDDILDLACIASAELRLKLRTIEPAGLIKNTIEGLRLEAERKSIRLEADLDAAAMPLVIDPDRIGQVVSILIANAIGFTPAGGHVEVRLERATGCARIKVSDSGTGISREALPHVFDRFRRTAGADTRADGGLGVGLTIVKDLVELHGGLVRAESGGPGQGATFTLELPRLPEGRTALSPADARKRADRRLLAGIRVLVVDHNLSLRESFESVLDEYGADVTAVASAPEALAVLERSRPDVMLFGDLAMRGESVYDLVREVTARVCPLAIASISSRRTEERERERAAGFRMHVATPIEVGALVEAVADLAGGRMRGNPPRLFAIQDGAGARGKHGN